MILHESNDDWCTALAETERTGWLYSKNCTFTLADAGAVAGFGALLIIVLIIAYKLPR